MIFPTCVIMRFQQRGGQDSKNINKDTFCRLSVTSAQCIIGTEKYPDNSILSNYGDDDYSQGNGQFEEAFRALTKNDFLQPNNLDDDFRHSFVSVVIIGYN